MVGDVLETDEARCELLDESRDVGPEVSLVFVGALLAGDAERLARVAASDAIHEASPWACIEGLEVAPDRSVIQSPFAHARDKVRGCEGFPFDVSDRARREACSSESVVQAEVETSDPGADGEDVEGM